MDHVEEITNDTWSVFESDDSINVIDAATATTVVATTLPVHVASLKRRFADTEEDGFTDEVSRKRRHLNEVEEVEDIKSLRPRHQRRVPYFYEYNERMKVIRERTLREMIISSIMASIIASENGELLPRLHVAYSASDFFLMLQSTAMQDVQHSMPRYCSCYYVCIQPYVLCELLLFLATRSNIILSQCCSCRQN